MNRTFIRKFAGCYKWFMGGGLLLCLTSCSTMDAVTGQSVYNLFSIQGDIDLGLKTIQANTAEMKERGCRINDDPPRVEQLNEMIQRIAAVSDMPELPYAVTLYHTNIVNAAAAPGGQMLVFEGLYDQAKGLVQNEDELAAVMAHEIAHVNCRHSTERLSKLLPAVAAVEVGAAVLEHNDENDWATGLRVAFAVGTVFYIPVHTRRDEFEADRVGLFYMARAGYDPRAAPRLWRRVAEKEEGANDKASIFATHPSSTDRYKALEKMIPYAMQEYARATGGFPDDYTPDQTELPEFDWRRPSEKD